MMKERIAVNPGIHFGKPWVAGTRIPVQSVLELVREGIGFHQIIRDYYPELEPNDIRACVQYAIDVAVGGRHPPGDDSMKCLADQDVYAGGCSYRSGRPSDTEAGIVVMPLTEPVPGGDHAAGGEGWRQVGQVVVMKTPPQRGQRKPVSKVSKAWPH